MFLNPFFSNYPHNKIREMVNFLTCLCVCNVDWKFHSIKHLAQEFIYAKCELNKARQVHNQLVKTMHLASDSLFEQACDQHNLRPHIRDNFREAEISVWVRLMWHCCFFLDKVWLLCLFRCENAPCVRICVGKSRHASMTKRLLLTCE